MTVFGSVRNFAMYMYVTKPTRSTQPCIPLGSLNQVPALIGWVKGCNVTSVRHVSWVPVAVRLYGCKLLYSVKLKFHGTVFRVASSWHPCVEFKLNGHYKTGQLHVMRAVAAMMHADQYMFTTTWTFIIATVRPSVCHMSLTADCIVARVAARAHCSSCLTDFRSHISVVRIR